jgi:hypothetical protein
MRIQLGKTAKLQAPGSVTLGVDARRGWQEQILANVQHSSKYAFDQSSTATSLADEELVALQRLMAEGPKWQETPAPSEEVALPYMIDPMVEEYELAAHTPEEPVAPPDQVAQEYANGPFLVTEGYPTALFRSAEGHPQAPIHVPEEQLETSFCQDDKTVVPELCNRPAQIGRTTRGTIEYVIQEDGRKLTPEYNKCGILTGVDFGDGTKLTQSNSDGFWHMMSHEFLNSQPLRIKSVAFDKSGCLNINAD